MIGNGTDVIRGRSSMSVIPVNDSVFLIHDSDSTSLIPENDSSTIAIPENTEPRGGHERRYSTGDIAIPYTRVKILSRYLASSTGSCHDYCKYGIKHDPETKKSNPMLKRITENQGRDMKETVTLSERQRTFPSPRSKRHNSGVPVVTGRKVSSLTNKEIVPSRQLSLPLKVKSDVGEKKKVAPPTLPSSVKKVLMRPIVSVFPKRRVKGGSQLKGLNEVVKAEYDQPGCQDVPQKALHIIELDTDENRTVKLSQIGTLTAGLSAPPAKKIARRTKKGIHATLLPPSSEKKCVIHLKDGKTRISRTPISSLASSKSSHSSASCERYETDLKNTAANKLPSKTRPRKGGVICTTDKDSAARKVNFRSGKVVELQLESRTSRRLKFRGRVPSDAQIDEVDTSKNNLKNKEVCEANIVEIESEKVVLKHQDVQEKKIVQSLLNNMIEETAGKLVESRKSKVKALVGAFETVISLQDSKTSSTVGGC
ncbi:unnamed protein product [Dovyalis caffra]|uniref:Calmodulin-binding domain-containing protein n=1 Tax=Dovyalis caffra TaxID=77055 RepID=A0AAV1QT22_9ROSI|nr:unnamed protein product [Dovyalis caffra]